eukprot:TRINITY_DN3847_c0_g1_i6.p1 TRINITY_DN3847_c0_g1~~TRINITY_DN3847_c0_g1_i6.p1  ORF type:complete len:701 (+),score=123.43 TRINITY_DN3847_c0_g1_i6:155-2257(+)
MMLLVNHFSVFVIPTFLPFMIQDFFPTTPYEQLGLQLGLLASAFNFGQFVSGYIWGTTADRIGRRPVLIMGIFGTLLGILVFGFAPNYYVALVARLVWGVLNGNIPVAKTYLSEVCDEKSQAKGFAVIGTAQSIGRLIGPIAGGYLAQPAAKYPTVFNPNGIFGTYKYLLPMLVGVVLCVVTIPFSFIHLTESLDAEKIAKLKEKKVKGSKQEEPIWKFMWNSPVVAKASSLFVLISFVSTFLEELLSLWLASPVALGGFSLNSSQIGLLLTLSAPVPLVFQSFFFSKCIVFMGYKLTFARSMILAGCMAFILPYCSQVYRQNGQFDGSFAFLTSTFGIFLIGRFYAFAAVYALINNSCEAQRGAVNGFAQSLSAGGRIAASALGTTVLTLTSSVTNSVTDYHLVFNITFVMCLITAAIDYTLPDSINVKPKSSKEKPSSKLNKDQPGGTSGESLAPLSSVPSAPSMLAPPSQVSDRHSDTDSDEREMLKHKKKEMDLKDVAGARAGGSDAAPIEVKSPFKVGSLSSAPPSQVSDRHSDTDSDEREMLKHKKKEMDLKDVAGARAGGSDAAPIEVKSPFLKVGSLSSEGPRRGGGLNTAKGPFRQLAENKTPDIDEASSSSSPARRKLAGHISQSEPPLPSSQHDHPSQREREVSDSVLLISLQRAQHERLFTPLFQGKLQKQILRESHLYMRESQMNMP